MRHRVPPQQRTEVLYTPWDGTSVHKGIGKDEGPSADTKMVAKGGQYFGGERWTQLATWSIEAWVGEKYENKLGLKKSKEMQQYAVIYLLLNYSTCFGRPSRPTLRVHKTVVAASGTDHTVWGASLST